jgi:hypothetical protein
MKKIIQYANGNTSGLDNLEENVREYEEKADEKTENWKKIANAYWGAKKSSEA